MSNLSYKSAKELKDAGFPQNVWDFENGDGLNNYAYNESRELHLLHSDNDEGGNTGNNYSHREGDDIDWIKCPTLPELIEVCGRNFNGLIRKGVLVWIATGGRHTGFYGDEFVEQGSTPEEAVKNLWIVLNAKENQEKTK